MQRLISVSSSQSRRLFSRVCVPVSLLGVATLACTTSGPSTRPDPRPAAPPTTATATTPPPPKVDAASAVDGLSQQYWALLMEREPEWATQAGDHSSDDRLADTGPKARGVFAARFDKLLADADALSTSHLSRAGALGPQDAISLGLLRRQLRRASDAHAIGFPTWNVHQMYGPQAMLPDFMATKHPMKTQTDVENLLARYRAVPAYLDGHIRDLRLGLKQGRSAPGVVVDRVVSQLDRLLQKKALERTEFGKVIERIPADLPAETRARFRTQILKEAQDSVLLGFTNYRTFLVDEYRANARATVGLGQMPGGKRAYDHLVRSNTTTEMSPDQIHEVGLQELARIEAKIAALAKERGFEGDVALFLASLRAEKAQYAPSRDALLESFRAALRRADAVLPTAFGRLPALPYKVEPLDASRERDAPAAYYQPGSPQDERPGVFAANLYRIEERPLFNSDVLSFHEAVPGHHLQIALSQELEGLPRFRTDGFVTAFVEGWALYSERLSDELGLYHNLESRVGYLGFAAWRASRLVVDTGLHSKGWTRQQAVDFLGAHTTLGKIDVENEIDRYIAMPGQALAYMIGCLHILSLREYAKASLGAAFSLPKFHDAVLGAGALPLGVLDAHVTSVLGIPARSVEAQIQGIAGPGAAAPATDSAG